MAYAYQGDFDSRTELTKYGSNALLLYALQLRFDIDDIDTIAAESLTDGRNDKKCDLIYIDDNEGVAVIAQAYLRETPQPNQTAKPNKASDLNTAAGWIFGRDMNDVPPLMKSAVQSLRNAIKDESVTTIYFWYSHNCDESEAVATELQTVTSTAKSLVAEFFPNVQPNIIASEIGNATLEKWYRSLTNMILVTDEIHIPLEFGGFEVSGDKWRAYQAYISGAQLFDLFGTYGDDLFSANPRRFLGIGKRTNVINLGIKSSAESSPVDFWAFNNGITALVNDYTIIENCLVISGISIINGAQTTGSIGTLKERPNDRLYVSLRIITCKDKLIIDAIISNNNKQNEMLPSDFRSNDKCQSRLRSEFIKFPHLYYSGGQRDAMHPRNREVLDPGVVAQILVSYNGNPVDAYSKKREIWKDDNLYASAFNDDLSAEHIIFTYSLSKAIDAVKLDLQRKKSVGITTDMDEEQLAFLSKRGSRILLLSTIVYCLEGLLAQRIANRKKLHFNDNSNFINSTSWWLPVVKFCLAFYSDLLPALSAGGLDSKEKAIEAMRVVSTKVYATMVNVDSNEKFSSVKAHIVLE
ncbi:hypothetical protein SDC9_56811 [bioreactor metagenome]|uniref:Abortive phage infection protein C-terminal domain-containing protein n=1 Tax=bioreactor metagenome TaxID=1076179 RepID=A0A644X324_9ZZZZ